jgi:energy-coupling factor transporter ATP-binding protein EcfA2
MSSGTVKRSRSNGASLRRCSLAILALLSLCALAPPSAAAAEAPVPLPSAPSESTPLIADIDPPSPAPGDEVIIRLKRPVHDPNLSVTFDDLNADIISSNANVIRVRVPLGVPPGTKPWIALKVSGIESPPYVLTAGVASHPDPLERKLFHWLNLNFGHNFELFSYLIAIGVIGFAAAGLSFFSVGIRKQRDAIKRIKAIEVFRAELSVAHERSEEAPSAIGNETPPSVPDALVAACATGECVLFAGTGLEATLGARTSTELLATLVEAAQDRVPLDVWRTLPAALLQGETERLKELLLNALGSGELRSRILTNADLGISPTNDLGKLLSLIPFSGVITLSWSHFLDRLFATRLLKSTSSASDKRYASISGLKMGAGFFLLRPFGEAEDELNFAFTFREFRDLRERRPELSRFIASAMARNSMLFLGCQVEEIEQFIVGANVRVTTDRIHYAVVPRGKAFGLQRSSMRSAYQIELIDYDPSDPDALGAFINELGRKLDASPVPAVARPQRAYRESPRVDALRLVNIGAFEDVTIPFEKPWTIILGDNGSGKSTILKSIAAALLGMDNRVGERCGALLKQGATNGSIEMRSGKETFKVELVRDPSQNRVTVLCPQDSPVQSGRWPVFGFPATRGVPVPFTERRAIGFPEPLVEDVLPLLGSSPDPRLNDLKAMIIDAHVKSELSDRSAAERARALQLRDALFSTLDKLTPGFEIAFSQIDKDTNEVYVKTSDGILPLSVLSQGITSTFGWAGTVMARLFDIYKDSPNPENEPALLLLDEMDVHLHPSWQQRLAPAIKSIFPKLSVVATSHSPLIVGTLNEGEGLRVHRVGGGFSVEQTPDYRRYRADQILTDTAFGLETARDPNREQELAPLRDEYAPGTAAQFGGGSADGRNHVSA